MTIKTVKENLLEEVVQQTRQTTKDGEPGERSVKSDSTNFEPTLSVFSVGNEHNDVATIFERMAFIPVARCLFVYFLVDTFE